MNDYQSVYDDLLAMEHKAAKSGFEQLREECREFRNDILSRFFIVLDKVVVRL